MASEIIIFNNPDLGKFVPLVQVKNPYSVLQMYVEYLTYKLEPQRID